MRRIVSRVRHFFLISFLLQLYFVAFAVSKVLYYATKKGKNDLLDSFWKRPEPKKLDTKYFSSPY